jgi:sugar lactone lactonase YvrE
VGGLWQGYVFGADTFSPEWDGQITHTYNSEIAVDRSGNLYCGSYQQAPSSYGIPSYYLVLKIDPTGAVSTLSQFPTMTRFAGPTLDRQGQLLVGTQSGLLRMDALGNVTNLTGTTGISGDGLTVTPAGDCIVADHEQILKITPSGNISILAGLAATPGSADGTGSAARFKVPGGIAVDSEGNVYVADTQNGTIRKITPSGAVTTLAGQAGVFGSTDGTGPAAQFYTPTSIAVDSSGNVYVSDNQTRSIRKISATGAVTTLAGALISPSDHGLAVDAAGNVYFPSDNFPGSSSPSSTINKMTPTGIVSTMGTVSGYSVGGLAVDRDGNLYVSQTIDRVVLKIDSNGAVTTLAGSGLPGTADGQAASAQFIMPSGLAVDKVGNIFVTDGDAIRRITPEGVVTTVGGFATSVGSEDGLGADAQFNVPAAIAVDSAGKLYVADTGNHSIRIGEFAGAPVITVQPQNQSVAAGGTAQFSVTASGLPTPTYQWYLNGIAFSGATASTLSFTSVRSSDAGDYSVVVTNALGSVTSSKATLTVSGVSGGSPTPPTSGSGGGGGGTIGAWFVVALLALRAICGRATMHKVFPEKRSSNTL